MNIKNKATYISSYFIYKTIKLYFSCLNHFLISRFIEKGWSFLSDRCKNEKTIKVFSVFAPRWNTHALIANTGKLKVEKKVRIIGLEKLSLNADWYLVIYSSFSKKTVYSSSKFAYEKDVLDINLEKGNYIVSVRIYEIKTASYLPQIEIDDKLTVKERPFNETIAKFPNQIFNRVTNFNTFINKYVFLIMKGKIKTSEEFLRNEFLPVGNPNTVFEYGYIPPFKSAKIELSDSMLRDSVDFYIVTYNSSSFPIYSQKIQFDSNNTMVIPKVDMDSFYLIRINVKNSQVGKRKILNIKITD